MAQAASWEFPISFGSIQKGTIISPSEIERATQKRPGTTEYRWACLGLIEQIRQRRDDLEVHLRCEGDSIVVMTDEEAEEHTWHRIQLLVSAVLRIIRGRARIDRGAFAAVQLRVAEARDLTLTANALTLRKLWRDHDRKERLLMGGDGAADNSNGTGKEE